MSSDMTLWHTGSHFAAKAVKQCNYAITLSLLVQSVEADIRAADYSYFLIGLKLAVLNGFAVNNDGTAVFFHAFANDIDNRIVQHRGFFVPVAHKIADAGCAGDRSPSVVLWHPKEQITGE